MGAEGALPRLHFLRELRILVKQLVDVGRALAVAEREHLIEHLRLVIQLRLQRRTPLALALELLLELGDLCIASGVAPQKLRLPLAALLHLHLHPAQRGRVICNRGVRHVQLRLQFA